MSPRGAPVRSFEAHSEAASSVLGLAPAPQALCPVQTAKPFGTGQNIPLLNAADC